MKSILPILFIAILANVFPHSLNAQLLTCSPSFPTEYESIIITFNAALGSGGLAGYTGDIYAHTGVITNYSTSLSDWRHVKTNWGQNTPDTKLTALGGDMYQLTLSPSLRSYYNLTDPNEHIEKLAFVFRSAVQVGGQWLEGKTESGGDIFYEVSEAALNVSILQPDTEPLIIELGQSVSVSIASLLATTTSLFLNGELLQSVSGSTGIDQEIIPNDYGVYWLKATAQGADGSIVADSTYFFVRPPVETAALPAGVQIGINPIDGQSLTLVLYAPSHDYVFAIGDFSSWRVSEETYMKRSPDGQYWWTVIDGLNSGQEYAYQYLVDGVLRVADPYSHKVLDPWNDAYIGNTTYPNLMPYPSGHTTGIVSVLQTDMPEFNWQINDFAPPANRDLLIYELLIRDFVGTHSYATLIDTLDYLQNLGVNVIELMPVTEFEGNISWGYNISFAMALDKYYGTPQTFKQFVDACHERGMAVVMDMVLNHHFGQSPLVQLWWDKDNDRPAANNPYFNPIPKHDFNVGYDFNHESNATRRYVTDVTRYWLNEYKVDGYRFDLSKGFTQNNTLGNTTAWGAFDLSRINIWKAISDSIRATKPNALLILEHFADNAEEETLSDYGLMLWGNMNYNYNEASMGWVSNSNFANVSYLQRGWNNPNLVGYMESHDEERLMYKNLQYGNQNTSTGYDIQQLTTALQRMELATTFFLTVPGPKMIWQFGELGYDYSINYCTNGTINDACRLDPKPIRWDYLNNNDRYRLYQIYAALNNLRGNYDVFKTDNFTMQASGVVKKITLNGSDMDAIIVGNFGVTAGSINPAFTQTGTWYEYFSGTPLNVSNTNDALSLEAGEYRLYTSQPLPPLQILTALDPALQPATNNHVLSKIDNVWPNPAANNTSCTIALQLERATSLKLSLLNQLGQEVAVVFEGTAPAGQQYFEWNDNNNSSIVATGLYWVSLQTTGGQSDIWPLLVK